MAKKKTSTPGFKPNLNEFRSQEFNEQVLEDALHDRQAMEEAQYDYALGIDCAKIVSDPLHGKSQRYMLQRAADEAAMAVEALLHVDLFSDQGIEKARSLQFEAKKYRELIVWLDEAVAVGTDAATVLEEHLGEDEHRGPVYPILEDEDEGNDE